MISLSEDCELVILSEDDKICDFDCDHVDLNDFFCNDALNYQNQLLGQTSFFRHKESNKILCAYTLSNDSIKVDTLPGSRRRTVKKQIPHAKSQKSYPATLIGRLGVSKDFAGNGIGTQLMDFIKSICITQDANKCRFLLVDAYNTEKALGYYTKNEFIFLFPTEEQEKQYYGQEADCSLKTRFMYFDLMNWIKEVL